MPVEQQRLIAAQQVGGMAKGSIVSKIGPTNPPSFYIPGKPKSVGSRIFSAFYKALYHTLTSTVNS